MDAVINEKLNTYFGNTTSVNEFKKLMINKNLFIAGGFVNSIVYNNKTKDMDLYCFDINVYTNTIGYLIKNGYEVKASYAKAFYHGNIEKMMKFRNRVSDKYLEVDLMLIKCDDKVKMNDITSFIVNSFDIDVCMYTITYSEGYLGSSFTIANCLTDTQVTEVIKDMTAKVIDWKRGTHWRVAKYSRQKNFEFSVSDLKKAIEQGTTYYGQPTNRMSYCPVKDYFSASDIRKIDMENNRELKETLDKLIGLNIKTNDKDIKNLIQEANAIRTKLSLDRTIE